jgi:Domain of unknown function (DUF4153)
VSSRTAFYLCAIAFALGLVGDLFMRPGPVGAGAALWLILAVGTALAFARVARPPDLPTPAALLLTAAFFGACLAWRDADELRAWNVFATLVALTMGLLALRGLRLRAAGVVDYALGVVLAGFRGAIAPLVLVGSDLANPGTGARGTPRRLWAIAIGLLITIPVVVVFGGLLVSADPVFERLATFLIDWNLERVLSHLVVIGLLSWLAAGYLRAVVVREADRAAWPLRLPLPGLGAIEIGVPLGALALLFLAFVIVQARYLFGGAELVRTTVGLTYAEYARRGFFELVAVEGLVLPVLLAAEAVLRRDDGRATRVLRLLGSAILLLVGLIVVSAAYRLRLYHDAYGLTQDRVYAAAMMIWIAAALAWFGATTLRGHSRRFVFGAVVAGFVVVAAMDVVSPDALIARTNLARADRGAQLDTAYLRRLSADASGVLASAVPRLPEADRCLIVRRLAADQAKRAQSDWRSWNLGRSRADRAFATVSVYLSGCSPAVPARGDGSPGTR